MKILRVIIKESVSEAEIDRVAKRNNWHFFRAIHPTEKNPYEKIWFLLDGRTSIHYIEDYLINLRYFVVKGEDLDILISQIQSSVKIYKREEILSLMEKAVDCDQHINAIYHIGVMATQEFDPHLFKLFIKEMEHPDPEVRKAAIFASAYAAWPEFREPLEHLQQTDLDAEVRAYASLMLASHIRFSWNIDAN